VLAIGVPVSWRTCRQLVAPGGAAEFLCEMTSSTERSLGISQVEPIAAWCLSVRAKFRKWLFEFAGGVSLFQLGSERGFDGGDA